jgi:transposase-like protein
VRTKAVHITLGVHADGSKEIPELWLAQNETAKFRRRAWSEVVPFPPSPATCGGSLRHKCRRGAECQAAPGGQGERPFPQRGGVINLFFLVLHRSKKESVMPPREWTMVSSRFAVLFGMPFTTAIA